MCNCVNCGAPLPEAGGCEYCLTSGVKEEKHELGNFKAQYIFGWAPTYPELTATLYCDGGSAKTRSFVPVALALSAAL